MPAAQNSVVNTTSAKCCGRDVATIDSAAAAGAPAPELIPPAHAVERLARRLHFLLEKYDPTDDPEWAMLSEHQREIFRATVTGLLADRELIAAAVAILSRPLRNDSEPQGSQRVEHEP